MNQIMSTAALLLISLSSIASGAPTSPAAAPVLPPALNPEPVDPNAKPSIPLDPLTAIEDLSLAINILNDVHSNKVEEPTPEEAKELKPFKPFAQTAVDLLNVLAEAISPLNQEYEKAKAKFDNGGVAPVITEAPIVFGSLIFDDEPAPSNAISEPVESVAPVQLAAPTTPISSAVSSHFAIPGHPVHQFKAPAAPVQPPAPVKAAVPKTPVQFAAPAPKSPVQFAAPAPKTPVQFAAPSATFQVLTPIQNPSGGATFRVAPEATVPGLKPNPLTPLNIEIPANAQNGYSYMVHTPKGYFTQIYYG